MREKRCSCKKAANWVAFFMSTARMSVIGNHQEMGMRNFYLTDIDDVNLLGILWTVAGLAALSFAFWTSKTLEISFWAALQLDIQVLLGLVCLLSFFVLFYEDWKIVLLTMAPAFIFASLVAVWRGFYLRTMVPESILDPQFVQWLGSYWALSLLLGIVVSVYAILVCHWHSNR